MVHVGEDPGLADLRAQVDGEEVLGHEALIPHVVKDGCGIGGRNAGVGQTQDAIKGSIVEEGAGLRLAQAKDLVGIFDASNLCKEERVTEIMSSMSTCSWEY